MRIKNKFLFQTCTQRSLGMNEHHQKFFSLKYIVESQVYHSYCIPMQFPHCANWRAKWKYISAWKSQLNGTQNCLTVLCSWSKRTEMLCSSAGHITLSWCTPLLDAVLYLLASEVMVFSLVSAFHLWSEARIIPFTHIPVSDFLVC